MFGLPPNYLEQLAPVSKQMEPVFWPTVLQFLYNCESVWLHAVLFRCRVKCKLCARNSWLIENCSKHYYGRAWNILKNKYSGQFDPDAQICVIESCSHCHCCICSMVEIYLSFARQLSICINCSTYHCLSFFSKTFGIQLFKCVNYNVHIIVFYIAMCILCVFTNKKMF